VSLVGNQLLDVASIHFHEQGFARREVPVESALSDAAGLRDGVELQLTRFAQQAPRRGEDPLPVALRVSTDGTRAVDRPEVRKQAQRSMASLGIDPAAVARAIAFAIDQPDDVEIGDLTIRPTRQG